MTLSAAAVYGTAARSDTKPHEEPSQTVSQALPTSDNAQGINLIGHNNSSTNGRILESFTPTAISRWSLLNHKLPLADAIQSIYIYDFDNTRGALLLTRRDLHCQNCVHMI